MEKVRRRIRGSGDMEEWRRGEESGGGGCCRIFKKLNVTPMPQSTFMTTTILVRKPMC